MYCGNINAVLKQFLTRINGETFTGGGRAADDDIFFWLNWFRLAEMMKMISIRLSNHLSSSD